MSTPGQEVRRDMEATLCFFFPNQMKRNEKEKRGKSKRIESERDQLVGVVFLLPYYGQSATSYKQKSAFPAFVMILNYPSMQCTYPDEVAHVRSTSTEKQQY